VGSDGDGVTVGGNLVVSGTSTVNTFTAGPVSATTLNTSGAVVFNDAGADVDFRVEGDTDANLLFVDASADAVGIGTSSPSYKLDISTGSRAAGANYSTSGMSASSVVNIAAVENDLSKAATLTLTQFNSAGSISVGYASTFAGFMAFGTSNGSQQSPVERMRIDSSGNVGIGTSSPAAKLQAVIGSGASVGVKYLNAGGSGLQFYTDSTVSNADTFIESPLTGVAMIFKNGGTERARIDSSGNFFVNKTTTTTTGAGGYLLANGELSATVLGGTVAIFRRDTDDGTIVAFSQDGITEGTISVSGGTVSYNPFLGSHSGALADWSRPEIKIGTVMDTIDELLEYKVVVIDVQEEVPAKEAVLDEEGNEVEPAQEATTQTVQKRISYNGNGAVGSSATVEYEGEEYTGTIQHEREEPLSFNKHLKVKVNDTAASKAVFGVFVGWNNDSNNDGGVYNDMLVGAVGNYVIRMAAGQEPQVGDLVEADGNGCAVVQDDDIIRTKTIAKVTSTIKQVTYDDGSFLVTCVLYCG
jgi:hypothetical protein